MAALHYHPRRSAGERELEVAVAAAERRADALEAGLDLLESHIRAAYADAAAAGVLDDRLRIAQPRADRRPRIRSQARIAARTALARAALRAL